MTQAGLKIAIAAALAQVDWSDPQLTQDEYEAIMNGDGGPSPKGLLSIMQPTKPSAPDMSVRQQRRWAQRKGHRE